MKSVAINQQISVNGLNRIITGIKWVHPKTKECTEKDEVLLPALSHCILATDQGERLQLTEYENGRLELVGLRFNSYEIQSNQCGYPCRTYWYICKEDLGTYHHKDGKWRKKSLKEMTTYAYYSPESVIKAFFELTTKSFFKRIDEETPILPDIAAETVVCHYCQEKGIEIKTEAEAAYWRGVEVGLVERANVTYNINDHFKAQINQRGNKGLDTLLAFMLHWLEAKVLKDCKLQKTPL